LTGGPQSSWADAQNEPLEAVGDVPRKEENTQEFPFGAVSRPPTTGSETPHLTDELPAPGEAPAAERLAADEEPVPLHAELDEPTPLHAGPQESTPLHAEGATAVDEGLLDDANRQLDAGDVPGALDAMRGIVDRQPEHVEPVIGRLTALLQDSRYRAHYEEVRLLLVDAYMVQGDYDRAMSLLHEPS